MARRVHGVAAAVRRRADRPRGRARPRCVLERRPPRRAGRPRRRHPGRRARGDHLPAARRARRRDRSDEPLPRRRGRGVLRGRLRARSAVRRRRDARDRECPHPGGAPPARPPRRAHRDPEPPRLQRAARVCARRHPAATISQRSSSSTSTTSSPSTTSTAISRATRCCAPSRCTSSSPPAITPCSGSAVTSSPRSWSPRGPTPRCRHPHRDPARAIRGHGRGRRPRADREHRDREGRRPCRSAPSPPARGGPRDVPREAEGRHAPPPPARRQARLKRRKRPLRREASASRTDTGRAVVRRLREDSSRERRSKAH